MKGPFSQSINEEFYKHYNVDIVVTKESGIAGGFLEKGQCLWNTSDTSSNHNKRKNKLPASSKWDRWIRKIIINLGKVERVWKGSFSSKLWYKL